MKYIPILFSTMMVQALLEGRKTMTRRLLKQPKRKDGCKLVPELLQKMGVGAACPYGKPGDVLYVREMHYRYGHWVKDGISEKTGNQKWKFVPDNQFTEVRFCDNPPTVIQKHTDRITGWYKRISLHMPKSATRIFLQNEGVKVERLQDISEADAVAEGIIDRRPFGFTVTGMEQSETAVDCFKYLWCKINGAESWDANPWLWAITFKRIEKPENFL